MCPLGSSTGVRARHVVLSVLSKKACGDGSCNVFMVILYLHKFLAIQTEFHTASNCASSSKTPFHRVSFFMVAELVETDEPST